MTQVKYVVLFILMVSTLIGGSAQLITLNDTAVVYNAYFQMALGFGLFLWLTHKLLSFYDRRYTKPIVNARDKKA